ncbi:MAG: hypothetical protein ACFFEV_00735 [Candidatus Thorarchaeota archaeon]
MKDSVFLELAKLITVQDLQTPLGPDVYFGEAISDAWERMMEACIDPPYDPIDRVSLVFNENKVIGCTFLDYMDTDYEIIGTKGSFEQIEPDMIVAAEMKVFDLLDIIPDSGQFWYFVLKNNKIVGTIDKNDLFKLPFRLCLLALTLELEQEILQLVMRNPSESWESMSSNRRQKIQGIFRNRYSVEPTDKNLGELLSCTSLSDKGVILRKTQKIGGWTKAEMKSVFNYVEDLRNACAHTNSEERIQKLLRSINFKRLVSEMLEIINAIQSLSFE